MTYLESHNGVHTLDPLGIIINSFALGDVIASAPVVNHMVKNYYHDSNNFIVVAKGHFRDLFAGLGEGMFRDFDSTDQPLWGIPSHFALGMLNRKNDSRFTRLTPKHMLLGQFASLQLCDRILPVSELNYCSLSPVDVSHYDIDFSRAVILVSTYRDVTRSWPVEELLKTAEWIKAKGYIPVFVGKTVAETGLADAVQPKTSLPDDLTSYGVDLRNRTSISELASIMSLSRAVCGVDSGPIHLAGTTSVPIICGYTTVSADIRMPIRENGVTLPIIPAMECAGCETRWQSSVWNFANCYLGHTDCVKHFTANAYISQLEKVLCI